MDDGVIYDGNWKNDIKEGKGIMLYNNDDRYEGYFKNDRIVGKGIMFHNNGEIELFVDFKNN